MDDFISTTSEDSRHRKTLRKYGDLYDTSEPIVVIDELDDPETIKSKFMLAFNWYNSKHDRDKARAWILSYVKTTTTDEKIINNVSTSNDFKRTAGWVARMKMKGTILPSRYEEHLKSTITTMSTRIKKGCDNKSRLEKLMTGKEVAKEKFRLQVKDVTNSCICDLDNQVEKFIENTYSNDFNFPEYLKGKSLCKDQCVDIINYFTLSHLQYISLALSKKDKFATESYSNFGTSGLKKYKDYITNIINSCLQLIEVVPDRVKQPRKARAKKIKTAEQLIKKLHYLPESKEFKLKSVPPVKMVKADQVWVFNVKYRKLGVYNASDSAGLSIKGSTLLNFNEATSTEKTIRKPEEVLKGVLEGGKLALRKTLKDIKCKEKKLTGRINDDTIILRVF